MSYDGGSVAPVGRPSVLGVGHEITREHDPLRYLPRRREAVSSCFSARRRCRWSVGELIPKLRAMSSAVLARGQSKYPA